MKRSLRRALFPAEMCFSTMVASQIRTKKKRLDEDKPFHEERSKKSHVSCKNVFQYHGGLPNSNNKIKNKKSYMTTNGFDGENYIAEMEIYSQRHFSKIGYLQERAVKVRKGSKFQTLKHLKHQGLLNGLI